MQTEAMTNAAREAQRAYMREWRRKNPDRVKAKNKRYWEKKAQQMQQNGGNKDAKTDV